uniref:Uncharacterized protein n=1 Tax=Anguilla anguilla TaxID=7936 RepID=A0A0E9USI5_ANGAN
MSTTSEKSCDVRLTWLPPHVVEVVMEYQKTEVNFLLKVNFKKN